MAGFRGRPFGGWHGNPKLHDVPTPRPAAKPDPAVTFIDGRGFRNESTIRVPKYGLTVADQKATHQRSVEAAQFRKLLDDLNFAAALELGAALKRLKDEG